MDLQDTFVDINIFITFTCIDKNLNVDFNLITQMCNLVVLCLHNKNTEAIVKHTHTHTHTHTQKRIYIYTKR